MSQKAQRISPLKTKQKINTNKDKNNRQTKTMSCIMKDKSVENISQSILLSYFMASRTEIKLCFSTLYSNNQ